MRLKDKVAIVIGAGQSPGEGMGNGRATALRFAQEGAKVSRWTTASPPRRRPRRWSGRAAPAMRRRSRPTSPRRRRSPRPWRGLRRFGRIDVLHYNVGMSIAGGDAPPEEITEEAFDRIVAINLRGAVMACKHVLPIMRAQGAGVIITISSLAAWEQYPYVTYKATKAALIAYTQQVAIQNAEHGIRANVILPGLMDTPMAVDTRAQGDRQEPRRGRRRCAMPRCRCASAWAPPGTSPMLRCSSRPTRPTSSPARRCRSTAACR